MIIHQTVNSEISTYDTRFYDNLFWVPHFHRSFELIYVIDGHISCTINGKTNILNQTDFALCLPNEIHSYSSIGESRSCVVVFATSFVPSFAKAIENKHADKITFKCTDIILNYIKEGLITQNQLDVFKIKSCLYAIFSEFLCQVKLKKMIIVPTVLLSVK